MVEITESFIHVFLCHFKKLCGFWSYEMSHTNVMKQLIRKGPVNYFPNIASKYDAVKNSLSL